jgi:hypothetical protein
MSSVRILEELKHATEQILSNTYPRTLLIGSWNTKNVRVLGFWKAMYISSMLCKDDMQVPVNKQ